MFIHTKQKRLGLASALAAGLAIALCSATAIPSYAEESSPAAASSAPAASADILRIATSGFVDSFNPFTSVYLLPTNTFRYVYENLVQYDAESGAPTAGLAEKWETTEGGLVWTFTLHDGLKWSDGEPLTSADVKYTYEQMMNDPLMATANGSLVSNFASVEAPDDKTVVITLNTAQAPNPGVEIPVVPEHIWSKIDNPSEFANDSAVVGSGPFTLEAYSANQSITLKANPNFWRGAPKISGIEYIYYTNSDAQLQALKAGEVDLVTGLTSTQLDGLKGEENITTNVGKGRRFTSLQLNYGSVTPSGEEYGTGNPALKEQTVREAIRYAIDIPTLMEQVLQGYGTVATSFIPASFSEWHLADDNPVIQKFDAEKAKSNLEADGWTVGSDGIREKDGEKLSLRLLIDADDSTQQSISEFLVPWLKEVGIEVKAESTDADTLSSRTLEGDYDMVFSGWSVNPDPDYQLSINLCSSRPEADGSGPTTQDGYCNPEFDALYEQQHTELDQTKREDLVQQMLALHYSDVGNITLWYANQLEAYRSDRFTGFTLQPSDGGMIANQAGYWGYLTVEPVADAAAATSGPATGLWIALGVVVLAGIVVAVIVVTRRKKGADTRE